MPAVPGLAAGVLCVLTTLMCAVALRRHWRETKYRQAAWMLGPLGFLPVGLTWLAWGTMAEGSPVAVMDLVSRVMKALCVVAYLKLESHLIGWRPAHTPEFSPDLVDSELMKVELIRHVPPCCCLPPIPLRNPDELLSYSSQFDLAVLQFVVITPGVMITGVILRYAGKADLLRTGEASAAAGWLYVSMISAGSAAIAGYFVVLHSTAVAGIAGCKRLQFREKAVWLVCVVFITEVQTVAIAVLAQVSVFDDSSQYEAGRVAICFEGVLCCGEMLLAAAAFAYVFPACDFQLPRRQGGDTRD